MLDEARLTIEEVIEHCEKTEKVWERRFTRDKLCEEPLENNFVKQYWEHKQVAEWLRELLEYRESKIAVPFKNKDNCSFWTCPVCNSELYWDTDYGQQKFKHCTECGTELDWKATESGDK